MKEDPLKSDEIYNFLLTLSVCHTVIPEKKYEDPETQGMKDIYKYILNSIMDNP